MSTALPEPNAVVPNVPQKTTPRLSLFRTLEAVKAQVEYDFFGMKEDGTCFKPEGIYLEVCLLIAEMYIKPPEMIVRIRSSEMEAGIVQEVYSALEHHHIEHVVDRFREQTGLIHRKTSYLQTALYNVLFEFDAYYMNRVTHDLNSGKKGV